MLKVKKQTKQTKTNRWTGEIAEMSKKDIILSGVLLLVSLGMALVSVACTMSSPYSTYTYHCSLELTRGVTGVHNCSKCWGLWTVPAVTDSLPLATQTLFRNKNTHCSSITRHQVVTWPLRLKQHTRRHTLITQAHVSIHTPTLYSIQCTTPYTQN